MLKHYFIQENGNTAEYLLVSSYGSNSAKLITAAQAGAIPALLDAANAALDALPTGPEKDALVDALLMAGCK